MLNTFVQQQLHQQLDAARNSLDQQKPWEAYKIYSSVPDRFKGYELPDDVVAQIKSLAADERVKKELAAVKAMNSARKALNEITIYSFANATSQTIEDIGNHRPAGQGARRKIGRHVVLIDRGEGLAGCVNP